MFNLNLIYPEKSNISYEIINFPDGQNQLNIDFVKSADPYIKSEPVIITTSLKSFRDVEILLCAVSALRTSFFNELHLRCYYLLGSRSDRIFTFGQAHYIRDVIAPIINSCNFSSIQIFDAHSDVTEGVFPVYFPLKNTHFIKKALTIIDNRNSAQDRLVFISPDAGALKKVSMYTKEFGIKNLIIASKVRNILTGEIVSTIVPDLEKYNSEFYKFIIIDDICDGGKTFIEIAKVIKNIWLNAEIYLIISHGIFSQGLKPFKDLFKCIFVTDSYRDIENINCEFVARNEKYINLLNQIRIDS